MEIEGEMQMERCKNTRVLKKEMSILLGSVTVLLVTTTSCAIDANAQTVIEPVKVSQSATCAPAGVSPQEQIEYHGYSCGRPACANHHHDSESQRQKAVIFKNQQLNHNIFTVFGGTLFLWMTVGIFSLIGRKGLEQSAQG
ncbi:MAG: hypothetical protein K2W95_03110 [Candidatus Obscuribacterales bacterium]|nr:hypothetical protein [Candidatus Obscuribacterales bacterium]